ncbi:ergothioneine biosynthesis protein EgtC [Planotetraspora kaengkrachanensis]|uniref:Gamma-glutamyl-hercynylcysteine sulfoxide hydrolase n=1 Tax=Planotetraspora kaengkrachanensis TaxID=575193 RepID=A0A8J3M2K2_9ACTN|nr:ergothioneine biosynthesis protein EgtC [Planotetraspora kaengkrachanensis]GIG77920.1 gamma-glutamyl-hercynylcysteine sulfoxide hydrolase [Planotetraspora kaengkrachanensis]
MCRHLAYLGEPVTLREVLIDPPFGLHRQAWAPRRQRYGTVNADGFGAGWYADGDPVPARYRHAGPMWADDSFADVARVTRTRALLAAVRSATEGTAPDVSAACPFRDGRHLFSHNGVVAGWPGSAAGLAGLLPAALLLDLPARSDSALVWALVRHRLAGGSTMAGALARTVRDVAAHADGRLNLLITDGEAIAATAYGDTLAYRVGERGVVVASEPSDDDPGWVDVPDASLLVARGGEVSVSPIEAADTEEA